MRNTFTYYTLGLEPKGKVYNELISSSCSFATYAQFVIRHTLTLSVKTKEVLKELQPFMFEQIESMEWPGTKLMDSTATIFRYHLEYRFIRILKSITNNLYDWKQPELPEDLSFLRKDLSAWFGSISHEKDSFFLLTNDEYARLVKQFPIFLPIISKDESVSDE